MQRFVFTIMLDVDPANPQKSRISLDGPIDRPMLCCQMMEGAKAVLGQEEARRVQQSIEPATKRQLEGAGILLNGGAKTEQC